MHPLPLSSPVGTTRADMGFCVTNRRLLRVVSRNKSIVSVAKKFSSNAIDFQYTAFYFCPMHVEIIQCPQFGTVFKRQDGLRFTFDNYVTIIFNESSRLMLRVKTSLGHMAFPLPDDDTIFRFSEIIEKGKFSNRPSSYEYVEAKLVKGSIEYEAYLPWDAEA